MDENRKLNIDKLRFFGPLRIYIMEQKKHPEKPNEQILNKKKKKNPEDSTFSFIYSEINFPHLNWMRL